MEKKKSISFTFSIVAIILGVTLFKQFDFKNLRFEHPALAVVYLITFIISIYILSRPFLGVNNRK
jgi:predicted ferric reductase